MRRVNSVGAAGGPDFLHMGPLSLCSGFLCVLPVHLQLQWGLQDDCKIFLNFLLKKKKR